MATHCLSFVLQVNSDPCTTQTIQLRPSQLRPLPIQTPQFRPLLIHTPQFRPLPIQTPNSDPSRFRPSQLFDPRTTQTPLDSEPS